jgi:hypothetical protein
MDNLFCGACDTNGRCDAGVLIGNGCLYGTEPRRMCDSRCLVAGDGLLSVTESLRSLAGTAGDGLRIAGIGAFELLGTLRAEALRLEARVEGEGESVSLSNGAIGIRAPFPSSQGSFLPVARGTSFLTGALDSVFAFVCTLVSIKGAFEVEAISTVSS